VRAGETCAACGKKAAADDIKVEYKDFKGAELLDIQMRGNRPPEPAKEAPEPVRKKMPRSGPAIARKEKQKANTPLLIGIAVVLTALACYLLIKIFLWK
jgi:hypothetical protein